MGAVYKYKWGRKGRYIYNRDKLHKCGFDKAKTDKHRSKLKAMMNEIKEVLSYD